VYDAYGRMTQLKTYRNEELTVKWHDLLRS
jgi:hypothetical protein